MAENPSGEKPLQTSPESSPTTGVTSSQPREEFWAAATTGGDLDKALAQEAGVETSKTEPVKEELKAQPETESKEGATEAQEASKAEDHEEDSEEDVPSRVRLNLKNMGENSRKAAIMLKQGVPIEDIARALITDNQQDQEQLNSEDFEDPAVTDAQENLRIAGEELAALTDGVDSDYDMAKVAKLGPTLKRYLDAQNDLRRVTEQATSNRTYEEGAAKARSNALTKYPEAADPESPLRLMVIGLWNKASDRQKANPQFIEEITDRAASILGVKSTGSSKDVSTPPSAKVAQKALAKAAPHTTPVSGSATTSVAPKTSEQDLQETLTALLGSDRHLLG